MKKQQIKPGFPFTGTSHWKTGSSHNCAAKRQGVKGLLSLLVFWGVATRILILSLLGSREGAA